MKYEILNLEEKHHFTSDEKIKWFGYGEWVEEPDSVSFECMGHKCLISRVVKQEPFTEKETYFGGFLCGYVQVPKDHPLFGKSYEEMDITCHGGLSLCEAHEEHLIGFDCAHSCDLVPSLEKFRKEQGISDRIMPIPEEFKEFSIFNPSYKNIQYCTDEIIEMVDQLINIKVTTTIKKAATATEEVNEKKDT